MAGNSRFFCLPSPKRLGTLMVLVALSALTFQAARPGQGKPTPVRHIRTLTLTLSKNDEPPRLALIPAVERPLFKVDSEIDGAILKEAPEGIDDAIIREPKALSVP